MMKVARARRTITVMVLLLFNAAFFNAILNRLILYFRPGLELLAAPVADACFHTVFRRFLARTISMAGKAVRVPAREPRTRVEGFTFMSRPGIPTASCHMVLSPSSMRRL